MRERFLLRHLFQIFLAVTIAATLSYVPFIFRVEDVGQSSVAITVFLVFVLVFEINNAIQKHRDLKKNINLELSRVRRVHHLAEKMSPRKTKWSKEVDEAVHAYLLFFKKKSFRDYGRGREEFRAMTHLVYGYKPKGRREELLFAELLVTTRELAATRQNIAALIRQRISPYQWVVLLIIEVLVIISALLTQDGSVTSYYLNTSLLSAVFIVTFLIWEVDDYNENEMRQFADLYVKNKESLGREGNH